MNGLLKTYDKFLILSYFLTSSSHACCFCLFSDNKWPILVERQILFLIMKLCAVKMLLQARFNQWPKDSNTDQLQSYAQPTELSKGAAC